MKHVKFFSAPNLINSLAKKALLSSLLLSSIATAEIRPLDKVIAIVDEDVIMATEIHQRVKMVLKQIENNNGQKPAINVIQRQVLDQLVLESIQLQSAERVGISVSDADLDQQIARMKKANNFSDADLEAKLKVDGINMDILRNQLRRDMMIDQIQKGSVNRRIKISEQEVKNFLKSKQGQFWASPDLLLGHMVIPVPSTASSAEEKELQAKAQSLHQQLLNGADFRTLAISESKGQNALKGGDMGWRKLSQLPDLFAEALKETNPGEVTDPLRSGAGFHILKVYEQRGNTERMVDQSKVRHILLKTTAILDNQQAEAKLQDIRQQIIEGEDFADMAKLYSEDSGSMLSGGELGWSLPGKFVPEFEKVMNETPIGEISQPFRSQFGWHILLVDERRSEDLSEQVRINQATRMLRNRRFEEERMNWMQEIHSKAFIDIRS